MNGKSITRKICRSLCLNITICFIALSIYVLAPVQELNASEAHQHGAHVHGVGSLNVALDGHDLFMELDTPAANIVGFEHEPKNDAQAQQLHKALDLLGTAEKMVSLPLVAGCNAGKTQLAGEEMTTHHDETEHNHGADHHDEEGEDGHGTGHGEHSDHSDISVTYHFNCENPEKLNTIGVQLFEHFPGFEKIDVQLLTSQKQTAVTLTSDRSTLSF